MKIYKLAKIGAAVGLITVAVTARAVEHLRLTLQATNVVLRWSTMDGSGANYIVQYRSTLNATDAWQTLTAAYPAATGTNVTCFVHTNAVKHPVNNGAASAPAVTVKNTQPGQITGGSSLVPASQTLAAATVPLVRPADGLGVGVPLALYPPGVDLTGFIITDPATGTTLNGTKVSAQSLPTSQTLSSGPVPGGGDKLPAGNPGDAVSTPETGFYRVVENGIRLIGITNGMTLSGKVSIPVEVGAAGSLAALAVQEDGAPVGNSAAAAPFALPLQITLDTTQMTNGVHQINGLATWNMGDPSSGDNLSTDQAESQVYTINVYNEVSFPNWIDRYGELYDAVLINAQTVHSNADWLIDIYGSDAGYIGTFSGHTDDGTIYGWWNLVGPPPENRVYSSERYLDFVITVKYQDSVAGGGVQPKAAGTYTAPPARTYHQTDNWTTKGMWVVANQQAWNRSNGADTLDTATDGFVVIAGALGLTVRPTPNGGEAFRIAFSSEDDPVLASVRNAQWRAFRDAIYHPESRNLFYLGHGAADGIGAALSTNRFIPAGEIAAQLHTIPAGQTNRHGYRFVFLYACQTANGTLPESFGILKRENVPSIDYANAGLTPGTFIGWNAKEAVGAAGSTYTDHCHFIQHFQYEWVSGQGYGVKKALERAKTAYTDTAWINLNQLKVFGNWDLMPTSFNR